MFNFIMSQMQNDSLWIIWGMYHAKEFEFDLKFDDYYRLWGKHYLFQ